MTTETMSNGYATKDELFSGAPARRFHSVTLPVSKHKVRIRSITEREYSAYQAALVAANGRKLRTDRMEDANRRFIALCLVDGNGNQLLGKNEHNKLSDWDAADSGYLYDECAKHCGINTDDIEGLVKNSDETTD